MTVDPASYGALAEGETEVMTLRFEVVKKTVVAMSSAEQ